MATEKWWSRLWSRYRVWRAKNKLWMLGICPEHFIIMQQRLETDRWGNLLGWFPFCAECEKTEQERASAESLERLKNVLRIALKVDR